MGEQIGDRVNTNSLYVSLGSFEAIHRVCALEKSFPLSLSLKNSVQSTEVSKLSWHFCSASRVVVCLYCFCCPRQGSRESHPSGADADLCQWSGAASPGLSDCNHAVVCVNILHSQLWARGGWERVVYSFCHGKRLLKKEQALHPAGRPECDLPSQPRQHFSGELSLRLPGLRFCG